MADNINVTPGTGATVAADDIGGVLHQRMKVSIGADGAATDLQPAATYALAAGTGDVQAATGARILYGYSLEETTGSAAARLVIRDGTDATGAIRAIINLAAGESVRDWFGPNGIACAGGIFVDRTLGSTQGGVFYV